MGLAEVVGLDDEVQPAFPLPESQMLSSDIGKAITQDVLGQETVGRRGRLEREHAPRGAYPLRRQARLKSDVGSDVDHGHAGP